MREKFKRFWDTANPDLLRLVIIFVLVGLLLAGFLLFGHSGDKEVWDKMDEGTLSKTKEMLDDMHKRKIDMADSIYVINVEGYIGDSTRSEIEYAIEQGKEVIYLENENNREGR